MHSTPPSTPPPPLTDQHAEEAIGALCGGVAPMLVPTAAVDADLRAHNAEYLLRDALRDVDRLRAALTVARAALVREYLASEDYGPGVAGRSCLICQGAWPASEPDEAPHHHAETCELGVADAALRGSR